MTASAFFLTPGGTILEMDIPAEGTFARDRFDEQLESGDLRSVDAEKVERRVVSVDRVKGVDGIEEVPTHQWFLIGAAEDDDLDDDEPDPFARRTIAQLREYATAEGIDLGDARSKADILAAIRAAAEDDDLDDD